MTNLFVIAFFGFNVDGNETLKRTTAFIKQKNIKYSNFTGGKWAFFNNGAIYKLEQGAIFKLEQSGQVFPSFSPCSSLLSAASENNCLKYSLFFCNSMGPLHEPSKAPCWMANDTVGEGKPKRYYIIQKADILSFQGPTKMFTLHIKVWSFRTRGHWCQDTF